MDVTGDRACMMKEVEYTVEYTPGDVEHITIRKRDSRQDRCIQIHLSAPGANAEGFQVSGVGKWALTHATVSNEPDDCLVGAGAPAVAVSAVGGTGHIDLDGSDQPPCSMHFKCIMDFAASAPWVPMHEPLYVESTVVHGACPDHDR